MTGCVWADQQALRGCQVSHQSCPVPTRSPRSSSWTAAFLPSIVFGDCCWSGWKLGKADEDRLMMLYYMQS